MSGHSKWATTRHKKAVINAKRGKLFAKLIKNVEMAAWLGGGSPGGNPTFYGAIQEAKRSNVPDGNIGRAMKRGSGAASGGTDYETIIYGVRRPSGTAILIECLTDNRNRFAPDMRIVVTRDGSTMADVDSVQRLFIYKGVIMVPKQRESKEVMEDDLLEAALETDLEEVNDEDKAQKVVYDPGDTVEVRKAIETVEFDYDSSEVQSIAPFDQDADTVGLTQKAFRIIDTLEDFDDTQNVLTNLNLMPEVTAALDSKD